MTRVTIGLIVLALLLVAVEAPLGAHGNLPLGAFTLFGLTGCVAIVAVAKWVGKAWLQRPDDE
jgi:hypothetical protein